MPRNFFGEHMMLRKRIIFSFGVSAAALEMFWQLCQRMGKSTTCATAKIVASATKNLTAKRNTRISRVRYFSSRFRTGVVWGPGPRAPRCRPSSQSHFSNGLPFLEQLRAVHVPGFSEMALHPPLQIWCSMVRIYALRPFTLYFSIAYRGRRFLIRGREISTYSRAHLTLSAWRVPRCRWGAECRAARG